MDWEAVKLVGAIIGAVTGTLTLGEKLSGYTKRVYQYFKKDAKRYHDTFAKEANSCPALLGKVCAYHPIMGGSVNSAIKAHELGHLAIPLKKTYRYYI